MEGRVEAQRREVDRSVNPVLPADRYVPDVEARVWSDGRLYFYGSLDIGGRDEWCSDTYRVFSTGDLRTWVDHGVSFRKSDVAFATARPLAAPDCVEREGRYFLFFCMNGDGGRQGVAWSKSPTGPFLYPTQIAGVDQIDPTVLVDDDGRAYLFWGQISLKAAELSHDMMRILPQTRVADVLTESQHGFHEGASIRKIGRRYYLLFADVSRGRPTCLSYAISDGPLGPYRKMGVIIDNAEAGYLSWNNHGSLVHFRDQWYVVYHRSSRLGRFSRRVCMEPIVVRGDGTIDEVPMTTQGPHPPIDPSSPVEAFRACSFYGAAHTEVENGRENVHTEGSDVLLIYRQLRLCGQTSFEAEVRGRGRIDVHIGSPYWTPAGTIEVNSPKAWTTAQCHVTPHQGDVSLGLRIRDPGLNVRGFVFRNE